MIKSTLAIFVLFAICDFTLAHYYGSGPYCGYESNVNYATYPENIIQTFNFSSVTDCCRRCSENPACQAWTLNKDQSCYIRNTASYFRRYECGKISGPRNPYLTPPPLITSTASPSTTSGSTSTFPGPSTGTQSTTTTTKVYGCFTEPGANYPGTDIGGSYNVASVEQCCNLCGARAGCNSFAYLASAQYCFFKSASNPTNRESYDGMTSGVVTAR